MNALLLRAAATFVTQQEHVMTLRTVTISEADLTALVAIRPVVADAHQHPGRPAAIAAIDRLAAALDDATRYETLAETDPWSGSAPARSARLAAAKSEPPARATPDLEQRVQISSLLGFERLEVLREEREERYRISALYNGRFASEHVTDLELASFADIGFPSTAWVNALSALTAQLDVPDAEDRLDDVALLLGSEMGAMQTDHLDIGYCKD